MQTPAAQRHEPKADKSSTPPLSVTGDHDSAGCDTLHAWACPAKVPFTRQRSEVSELTNEHSAPIRKGRAAISGFFAVRQAARPKRAKLDHRRIGAKAVAQRVEAPFGCSRRDPRRSASGRGVTVRRSWVMSTTGTAQFWLGHARGERCGRTGARPYLVERDQG